MVCRSIDMWITESAIAYLMNLVELRIRFCGFHLGVYRYSPREILGWLREASLDLLSPRFPIAFWRLREPWSERERPCQSSLSMKTYTHISHYHVWQLRLEIFLESDDLYFRFITFPLPRYQTQFNPCSLQIHFTLHGSHPRPDCCFLAPCFRSQGPACRTVRPG